MNLSFDIKNEVNMLRAISDRIIVKLDSPCESVIVQISAKPRFINQGTVVSIGPLVSRIKVGDKVIFHPFDELELPEENLVVIREKSVLALDKDA